VLPRSWCGVSWGQAEEIGGLGTGWCGRSQLPGGQLDVAYQASNAGLPVQSMTLMSLVLRE
jgi:hypothetical protein